MCRTFEGNLLLYLSLLVKLHTLVLAVVIIQKCRSTIPALPATCHPYIHKQWDAQPYLRTALNTSNESIIYIIARFRLSSHHLACETGTWRRRTGPAGVNPTRCPWCSTADQIVVQDEQHVFFSCPHFHSGLRAQKPLLFDTVREASLWRIFNEYEVTYEDIAWFLKETKLMYTMR
jgi:hypothetical protein